MNFLVIKISAYILILVLPVTGISVNHQKSSNSLFLKTYGSAGVVKYKESAKKDIVLYNESGTVYAVFSFAKNTAKFSQSTFDYNKQGPDHQLLKYKYGFDPLAFYPEYTLAIFELKKQVDNKLYLYIDTSKKNVKIAYIDNTQLTVTDWQHHLLNQPNTEILEIKFNKNTNPLVRKPSSSAKVPLNNNQVENTSWRIKQFQGYWAELESFDGCGENKPAKPYRGWVRWTDGKRPLLSLFYDC